MTQDSTHDTAGAGSPAPAVASAHPGEGWAGADRTASGDVVPREARAELDRIRRRWTELPLAQAESRMPVLRDLVETLTTRSVPPTTPGPRAVPQVADLGPAVVVDQVTVLVWDAYAAGSGDGIPALLTEVRRALH